jgi:hypothetical protein
MTDFEHDAQQHAMTISYCREVQQIRQDQSRQMGQTNCSGTEDEPEWQSQMLKQAVAVEGCTNTRAPP